MDSPPSTLSALWSPNGGDLGSRSLAQVWAPSTGQARSACSDGRGERRIHHGGADARLPEYGELDARGAGSAAGARCGADGTKAGRSVAHHLEGGHLGAVGGPVARQPLEHGDGARRHHRRIRPPEPRAGVLLHHFLALCHTVVVPELVFVSTTCAAGPSRQLLRPLRRPLPRGRPSGPLQMPGAIRYAPHDGYAHGHVALLLPLRHAAGVALSQCFRSVRGDPELRPTTSCPLGKHLVSPDRPRAARAETVIRAPRNCRPLYDRRHANTLGGS